MKLRSTERSAKILVDFCGSIEKHKTVLDLGANDGALSRFVFQDIFNYVPVDLKQINHNNFVRLDLNHIPLPWKDSEFDYIFASMILEHVFNPYDLIKEIYRILKKDGILIVATPDEDSLIYRLQSPFKRNPHLQLQYFGHHWSFTVDNAGFLLTETGFKIEKIAGRFGFTSPWLIGIAPAVLFLCTK